MDYIERKMEQDRLKRSVVKYWNVNYSAEQKKIGDQAPEDTPGTEAGEKKSGAAGSGGAAAGGKTGRDMEYNPTTKSRSGNYGKQPVEAEHAQMIDSILDEKKFDLDKILEDTEAVKKAETPQEPAEAVKKVETPQEAAQAAAEEMMREIKEREELAAQTLQRAQSTDESAKAARVVEETMAANRASET